MDALKFDLNARGRKIFDLTLELVNIPSTSRTPGERKIADAIHDRLSTWSYFKSHPHHLISCPVKETGKRNVLALVRGAQHPSRRTLVYLGHMDTVDIKEYKSLEAAACDPELLHQRLRTTELPRDVAADLDSNQWLFGRGSADMKAGVAVLMELFREAAENPKSFSGNLVLAVVCDEEADSQGMISLAEPLSELAAREGLDLLGGINTDVVSQRDGNAPHRRHIYFGAMGKIVPGVFVVGKGSHVGESLQGFDVNQFLSRLTWLIDDNMDLSDAHDGEITHPPVSLKQADLKEDYNGQVPFEGYAYYNFLNYKRGPARVLEQVSELASRAFDDCVQRLSAQTRRFFQENNTDPIPMEISPRVMAFSELCDHVRTEQGQEVLDQVTARVCETMGENPELREHSLELVRAVWKASGLAGPAAVVFIMPPYYPANDPEFDHPKFKAFNAQCRRSLAAFQAQDSPYELSLDAFFPYLSDASFCAYTEGPENRTALESNMPCWGRGWDIDLDRVEQLNMPILDMGVHGKDFHKRFERVHVPYSMGVLPGMIQAVTRSLLENKIEEAASDS